MSEVEETVGVYRRMICHQKWEAVSAIEMHMVLSCITIEILQDLSICYIGRLVPAKSVIRGHCP